MAKARFRNPGRKILPGSLQNGTMRTQLRSASGQLAPEPMPTTPTFVDTNVLLYAVSTDPAESDKRDAARTALLSAPICFSVQVAQEFFVNATRKLKPPLSRADALKVLDQVSPVAIAPLDYELFEEATRFSERFQLSYWDAAIVVAAKNLNCVTLYSEDLSHGQNFEGIVTVNPFRALAKT